jgi:hypothetical protein
LFADGALSARRTNSSADGQSAARVQVHPVTSAPLPTCIFGVICPTQVEGAALILPARNTEAVNLHLAEIAETVAPGAHAVLVVDQAGWYLSRD